MSRAVVRRRSSGGMSLFNVGSALDMMLAGHHSVIGNDFIMTRNDPFNADIGHLNPEDLRAYDQSFINALIDIKAQQQVSIPKDLKSLCATYVEQRDQLSRYHVKAIKLMFDNDVVASKELGNFDEYYDKVVLRNEAEQNVFYDYIALYRKVGHKRAVVNWRIEHASVVNKKNMAVIAAYENAKFAVLRIDESLEHGVIKITNIITETEHLLIDRALNASGLDGHFLITQLLDMGDYVMTSGGAIPVQPTDNMGKSILSLLQKHIEKLRASKRVVNTDIIKCVRELYGFCLRCGVLQYMTIK